MRPAFQLAAAGGTAHLLPKTTFMALQAIVEGLGADTFPLFLRLGGSPESRMQPVTARALLKEVELFVSQLRWRIIPGIQFLGAAGEELGTMYSRPDADLAQSDQVALSVTPEGIRLVVSLFPPPAGFRSRPGLKPLHYECYFQEIRVEGSGFYGVRTADMGGAGQPVAIPPVPVPPVTQWDHARVAGKPVVPVLRYIETPATEVYRDLLHALVSACEDSLRLRTPLVFRAG